MTMEKKKLSDELGVLPICSLPVESISTSSEIRLDGISHSVNTKRAAKIKRYITLKQSSYTCEICDRVFTSRQTFKNHKYKHRKKKALLIFSQAQIKPTATIYRNCIQFSNSTDQNKLCDNVTSECASYVSNDRVNQFPAFCKNINLKSSTQAIKEKEEPVSLPKLCATTKCLSTEPDILANQPSFKCQVCRREFTQKKTFNNHKKHHRKNKNALNLSKEKELISQKITDFIRSIRHETENTSSEAQNKPLEWTLDSSSYFETMINNPCTVLEALDSKSCYKTIDSSSERGISYHEKPVSLPQTTKTEILTLINQALFICDICCSNFNTLIHLNLHKKCHIEEENIVKRNSAKSRNQKESSFDLQCETLAISSRIQTSMLTAISKIGKQ